MMALEQTDASLPLGNEDPRQFLLVYFQKINPQLYGHGTGSSTLQTDGLAVAIPRSA